jgi:uncharacterized membrane protein HdeD (DUF308 family)
MAHGIDRGSGSDVALAGSAVALAGATLAWPAVTVPVLGVLFGLNLLITGSVRAVLMTFAAVAYPVPYRIVAAVLGALTAVLGVLCLRDVQAAAVLLALVAGIGWLLGGVTDLVLGRAGDAVALSGWRLGIGTAAALAAIGVLVWPSLTLAGLVPVAAVLFLIAAAVELGAALIALRRRRIGLPP